MITNYQTIYIVDDETRYGPQEKIIVQAIGNDTLSNIASSYGYPQDIIYYDAFNDIGKYSYLDAAESKGIIYRRIDTERNIDCCYDWRNVEFKRWKISSATTIPQFSTSKKYTSGEYFYYNGALVLCHESAPKALANPLSSKYFTFVTSYIDSYILSDPYIDLWCLGTKYRIALNLQSYEWKHTFSTVADVSNIKITRDGVESLALPNVVFHNSAQNVLIENIYGGATFLDYIFNTKFGYIGGSCTFTGTLNHATIGTASRSIIAAGYFDYSSITTITSSIIGESCSDFSYNKITSIYHSIINGMMMTSCIGGLSKTLTADYCIGNNLPVTYFGNGTKIGICFIGNTSNGGQMSDTSINFGDYFMHNEIPNGAKNLDLTGYDKLHWNSAERDSSHCGYIIRGRIIASGDGDIGTSYIATKPGETSFDII